MRLLLGLALLGFANGCATVPASELRLNEIAQGRPGSGRLAKAAELRLSGDRWIGFVPGFNVYQSVIGGYALNDKAGNRYRAVNVADEMDAIGLTMSARRLRMARNIAMFGVPLCIVAAIPLANASGGTSFGQANAVGVVMLGLLVATPLLEWWSRSSYANPALRDYHRWLKARSGLGAQPVGLGSWAFEMSGQGARIAWQRSF